jgi:hypothetical protein
MKSAEAVGPSKNASQDWSAGLMRRLRPSLVISTWRTFGGKVMDFGKRTAWLRLVVNTVERVTLLLHFLTPGISHWDIPLGYPTGIYVTVLPLSTRISVRHQEKPDSLIELLCNEWRRL